MSRSTVSPQPTAVALIRGEPGSLCATGAFDRFSAPFAGTARPGDLFVVRRDRRAAARPVRRIGRPSSVQAVIEALALHHGHVPFTRAQEKAARRQADNAAPVSRRDLTDLTTFTIDGEHTRDFDDAISARREGDRIRVWVHVADVSAYVRPGSDLDTEARRRATSVYLPTMTVPMLPRALSDDLCSLTPGQARGAVTAEFLLAGGQVVQRDFYRSQIRSDARLTYDHVDDMFLGRAEPGPTYAAALAAARQAATDRTRAADTSDHGDEPVFAFDGGDVSAMSARRQGEAHRLIERLMVLANQEVAALLDRRGAPGLYRTHADADAERLDVVFERLVSLGAAPAARSVDAMQQAVYDHEAIHGANDALRALLWGVRVPACYSREPDRHHGLGIDAYTHFTSPIRRYADLVVHRALLAEIGAERYDTAPRHVQLPELAEHLTERTLHAKRLGRRAETICRVSLLRRRLNAGEVKRTLKATVTGMSAGGCFAAVDCAEGMLDARTLGGAANAEQTIWTARDGRTLRLGDELTVRIAVVDPVRGRLALRVT